MKWMKVHKSSAFKRLNSDQYIIKYYVGHISIQVTCIKKLYAIVYATLLVTKWQHYYKHKISSHVEFSTI